MASAPAPVNLTDSPVNWTYLRDDPPSIEGDASSGLSGSLDFKVAAKDWLAFVQFLAGTPHSYTVGGVTVSRIVPCSHPANARLLCTGIGGKAVGGWTAGNPDWIKQFSDARVKATFTTVPYPTDGSQPFLSVSGQQGSESYTLAGVRLAFSDGTPVQADAARAVPTQVYSATIYQCVGAGDDVYLPLVGKVNSVAMTLGSFLCPIGTVRFDNGGYEINTASNFVTAFTRNLKLTYRPVPWNQFIKPTGVWDTPTDPSSNPVYASADLTALFA